MSAKGDAATLREAARVMRARAEAATPGPWTYCEAEGGNRDQRRTLGTFSLIHDGKAEVALVRGFTSERESAAAHIASWDPAVALAVADWLDHEAVACGLNRAPFVDETHTLAHAVATAYLNGGSP